MIRRMSGAIVVAVCLTCAAYAGGYDVVWDSPSADSSGSMPLGNGDIGLNVWTEAEGGLLFYLSKTDAWSENARLLKLGRIRVTLTPNPFAAGRPFTQRLDLEHGAIEIQAGDEPARVKVRVWVDANYPAAHVEVDSLRPCDVRVALEMWRTAPRKLSETELFSAYGLAKAPQPVVVEPDTVLGNTGARIVWHHRNERSIWATTLRVQGMDAWAKEAKDPLLHRTFGGLIEGPGFVREGAGLLSTGKKRHAFSVYAHTQACDAPQQWLAAVEDLAKKDRGDWDAHTAWWKSFWDRSWLHVTASGKEASTAETVSRGYALQRFISACSGRGGAPIKFNGSIFTVDAEDKGERLDADYRRWGGPYWFQNTRLCYWPMLAAGDYEMMVPLFAMFREALPFAKARTKTYYGHEGAFYPETMYFWGAYANDNYGWNREGLALGLTENQYIRYYWSGALELTAMMLDYLDHTGDQAFARETLLPVVSNTITFFDQHWKRDEAGRIRFDPAMALETYRKAVNPTPEVAGLRHVLPRLLALPEDLTTDAQRKQWARLLKEVPPLPMKKEGEMSFVLPAESCEGKQNSENVALYAVFPYRLFAVGKPDLAVGRATYARREVKRTGGWSQDPIQAALLGLTEEAKRDVVKNFSTHHPGSRFPAFWGPNFDWIPDQDHGNVALLALQTMLMQCEGQTIRLLPAWPKDWNVHFRLHAPMNTTIEGEYREGALQRLVVTPESRRADIVISE